MVLLPASQHDLHCFVWRKNPHYVIADYRMMRFIFGIAAPSFAANMAVKQNSVDYAEAYPEAAKAVHESFHVNDGLSGGDVIDEAKKL